MKKDNKLKIEIMSRKIRLLYYNNYLLTAFINVQNMIIYSSVRAVTAGIDI